MSSPARPRYAVPGLYVVESERPPARGLRTGVPAFLGFAPAGPLEQPEEVGRWPDFVHRYLRAPLPVAASGNALHAALTPALGGMGADGEAVDLLAHAVRGFFRNGGRGCVVIRLARPDPEAGEEAWLRSVERGLHALESCGDVDLVCVPDAMAPAALAEHAAERDAEAVRRGHEIARAVQRAVVDHCERSGTRFAVLDALPLSPRRGRAEVRDALERQARELASASAALYHPWLRTQPDAELAGATVPPCGHVAGVYCRVDEETGVHKAPANEALDGVLDLVPGVTETDHREIPLEVNCVRAFPRRGFLVWGARTLSGPEEPAWRYVPVRRLFLTIARWIERSLSAVAFEPNALPLWNRITRETSAYLAEQYRRGALQGASPQDAFYVRCDATTNPPESMELGRVVTEIGVAARSPNEFVVVRITHGAGGTTLAGPQPG